MENIDYLEKINSYRGFQYYIYLDGLMMFYVIKNKVGWRFGSRKYTYPFLLELICDLILETGKSPIIRQRKDCKYKMHKQGISLIEML